MIFTVGQDVHCTHTDSYLAVNLESDTDFHFSYLVHDNRTKRPDEDVDNDEKYMEKDVICDEMNASSGAFVGDLGAKIINNGSTIDDVSGHPSSSLAKCDIIEDSMLAETEEGSLLHIVDLSNEMWLGRLFFKRKVFKNTLRKHAMYNNFNLKHLKTNNGLVTTKCKDKNYPWHIHDSIVEGGLHFKVRTYNGTHSYSKARRGCSPIGNNVYDCRPRI